MHALATHHEELRFASGAETEAEAIESIPQPRTMSGAEAVIESLLAEGVDLIFGYPGGAIMPVYDALFDYQERIRHILVRHEQGATHAAQGYARASGRTGVCLVTSGPGATNLITGLADANIDSTPIVCITGQVASPLLGTDAFQETDVVGISMPITKWNYQITRPQEIPEIFAKAFYIARSGRPGPVVIDITKDAQINALEFSYKPCRGVRSYVPKPAPSRGKIKEAAALINAAERPYVLFGQGILLAHAENEFRQFLEKSGIPAAATLLGLSALPTDHPLHVGMLGMHGNYGPNLLTNQCDVLIAVGMRFDDRVTGDLKRYAKQAKVIHLDIDAAEIDKNVKVDVAIHADAKEALPMLTHLVEQRDHSPWLAEFKKCHAIEHEKVIHNELHPVKPGLTMAEVIRIISEKTAGDAVVVSDVGQHQMVAARYFRFKQSRSHITSGGLGTMGFCLPAAIGAKLGAPHREVIGIVGDGGFQMTIQELGVILQSEVAVKIVILNNNYLGMVRQWQQLFFDKRYSFTHLINPDFVAIARGYGLQAEKVQQRPQLEPAIGRMLAHDGAFLLEVVVEKEDNVFPMVPAGKSIAEVRLE
jgi:acetolactate synthase-1/2/3 large subunit